MRNMMRKRQSYESIYKNEVQLTFKRVLQYASVVRLSTGRCQGLVFNNFNKLQYLIIVYTVYNAVHGVIFNN